MKEMQRSDKHIFVLPEKGIDNVISTWHKTFCIWRILRLQSETPIVTVTLSSHYYEWGHGVLRTWEMDSRLIQLGNTANG